LKREDGDPPLETEEQESEVELSPLDDVPVDEEHGDEGEA
jgi:hypothetical protein